MPFPAPHLWDSAISDMTLARIALTALPACTARYVSEAARRLSRCFAGTGFYTSHCGIKAPCCLCRPLHALRDIYNAARLHGLPIALLTCLPLATAAAAAEPSTAPPTPCQPAACLDAPAAAVVMMEAHRASSSAATSSTVDDANRTSTAAAQTPAPAAATDDDAQLAEWERAAEAVALAAKLAALKARAEAAEAALTSERHRSAQQQEQLAVAATKATRLMRQLAEREVVIGELARKRNDATATRLGSYSEALKQALRRADRATAGLGATRHLYEELVGNTRQALAEIQEAGDHPCSCCGGNAGTAAASGVFRAAAEAGAARREAARWQEKAQSLQVEVQECQDDADTALYKLRRRHEREVAAASASERRAWQLEQALERERTELLFARQQLTQASDARKASAEEAGLPPALCCSSSSQLCCSCNQPTSGVSPPPLYLQAQEGAPRRTFFPSFPTLWSKTSRHRRATVQMTMRRVSLPPAGSWVVSRRRRRCGGRVTRPGHDTSAAAAWHVAELSDFALRYS